jgi:N-glycosylase/DNA lyase
LETALSSREFPYTLSLKLYIANFLVAQRDYKFGKGKHKSLTKATYDAVGDHFRHLWGKEAGWAHSVLFAADLKTFSDRLTAKVEIDVEEVKIKHEDSTVIEKKKVVVKREYVVDDLKEELGDEKENAKIESSRSQRAKRRRWE